MPDWLGSIINLFNKIIDYIKSPELHFYLFLLSGGFLFVISYQISMFGIENEVMNYRILIVITFISTSLRLILFIGKKFCKKIISYILFNKKKQKIFKSLKHATPEEKEVLQSCYINNSRTVHLKYNSGLVQILISKGYFFQACTISVDALHSAYNMPQWLFEHIRNNPKEIDHN
jgi:hypothetical protein